MDNDIEALGHSEIEYVADMLKAILWIKDDMTIQSSEFRRELELSLVHAEDVLRRLSDELLRRSGNN